MNNTGKTVATISAGEVKVVLPVIDYIAGCSVTAVQGETSNPRSRRELQKVSKEQMNKFVKDKYRKKER